MAGITQFSDLIRYMMPDLPGYVEGPTMAALRAAAREFCQRSKAWTLELPAIDLVEDLVEYDLTTTEDAIFKGIKAVHILSSTDVGIVAAGATTPTAFTVDTAGPPIKGHFTCTSAPDTTTIGKGARIVIAGVTYRILAFTAPGTGTNEVTLDANPGTGAKTITTVRNLDCTDGMNLEESDYRLLLPSTLVLNEDYTPNEDITGGLVVEVYLVPTPESNGLPTWIMTRYSDAIIWLALHRLLKRSVPDRSMYFLAQYNEKLNESMVETAEEIGA